MEMYLEVLKKYAVFRGRARRKEYWMFTLVNFIISFIFTVLVETGEPIIEILDIIYALAIFLPALAVTVRRLHDIGRSGWWVFIIFVPVIGSVVLFIFACLNSQMHDNKYGPCPKLLN